MSLRKKHNLKFAQIKKKFLRNPTSPVVLVTAILGVIALSIILKYSLDLRRNASVTAGTVILRLSPSSTTITPNQTSNIDLMLNTQSDSIDGVQVEALVSGSVPSNITFTPNVITGLNTVAQTLTVTTAPTKKLQFATITSNPAAPYNTNSTYVKLGTFSFTAPASGSMNIDFNLQNTIAVKTGVGTDILANPLRGVYTFAFASPSPSPVASVITSPSASPISSPTSIPTASPSPVAVSDTTPPLLAIVSPQDNSVINKNTSFTISATSADNVGGSGLVRVDFYLDNSLKCSKTVAPFTCVAKLVGKPGLPHPIVVKAYDKANNSSTQSITVQAQ